MNDLNHKRSKLLVNFQWSAALTMKVRTCFLLTSNVVDLGIVDNEGQASDKISRKSFTIGDVYEIVNLNGCWLIKKKQMKLHTCSTMEEIRN